MNTKYNIFRFSESYRHAERKHTLLLPFMMVLVVVGVLVLLIVTKPKIEDAATIYPYRNSDSYQEKYGSELDENSASGRVTLAPPPEMDLNLFSDSEIDDVDLFSSSKLPSSPTLAEIPKARVIDVSEEKSLQPVSGNSPTFVVQENPKTHNRFTPWMTRQEIFEHIEAINQGFETSFWDRGHWMTAVEGQIRNEVEEYRIIYEKAPSNHPYDWRYRISKTKKEFADVMVELKRDGFELVQSQAYEVPDGSRRYQGVWHKLDFN